MLAGTFAKEQGRRARKNADGSGANMKNYKR
jgi:hypothetical protein